MKIKIYGILLALGVLLTSVAVIAAGCKPTETPAPPPSPTVARTQPPTASPSPPPLVAKTSPAPVMTRTPAPAATPPPRSPSPAPTKPPAASPAPTKPQPSPPPVLAKPPGAVAPDIVDSAAVTFPGAAVPIKAYEARPKGAGPFPAMIVIHENRGLVEHTKDVARRFANQGYVAISVDLLSRVGGRDAIPADNDAVAAINALTRDGVVQDLQSAFDYLKGKNYVKPDRIGVIGYCWGGGNTLFIATRIKELRASVAYYGPNPPNIDDVANITGPVLGIYGEADTRITANVPALAEAMKKHNKSFEYTIYPGALHAFFNDTGNNYNAPAAAEAWSQTLAFLEKHLKS